MMFKKDFDELQGKLKKMPDLMKTLDQLSNEVGNVSDEEAERVALPYEGPGTRRSKPWKMGDDT